VHDAMHTQLLVSLNKMKSEPVSFFLAPFPPHSFEALKCHALLILFVIDKQARQPRGEYVIDMFHIIAISND
jgi:hypothetical protein